MSLKAKLISSISMFVLVLALLVVSVFALRQESFSLGGTISFEAKNVYAEITGTISGQENGPTTLPELEFSNNKTPDTSGWAKGALVFDPNVSPIQIKIEINVKNLSKERALYVKVEDLVGAVANLTKSVTVGEENKEGTYVKVLPLGSLTYTISLSPTDEGESVTGEYNYLITLIDESETQDIEIQAKPNMETLGSVASNAEIFNIGDTVELTATTESGSTFLAWATSLDPNEMEILSTSATYSFELTMDSPRTYYALFNQAIFSQADGDLSYTFYNEAKLASVAGAPTSLSGALEIPSVVSNEGNSYKTYSIGDDAFRDCTNLTSITIPEGVTEIGEYTFFGCRKLTTITIPEGVTSIGDYAFQNCSVLTEITIPEGVTSIGDQAFYRCSSLTSITIPEGVTSIGERAFFDCSGLTSITIPEGVTSIGSEAFFGCRKLTTITIPEGVTEIGEHAFSDCSSLKAFNGEGNEYYTIDDNRALLVDGGKTLLAYAIGNTATSYTIPEGVTSIGSEAFYNCSRLASITILEGVTSIGRSAFSDCGSLTQITINGNISTLDSSAFQNCTNLTKLTLGAKVTSLPSNLFTDNNLLKLTEIIVEEDSSLTAALPGYATWYKDDDPTEVTNFTEAGTYSTTKPTIITAEANQASLGSVSGGGEFEYGDTVTLAATASGSNTFLAWATSLDPNEMEIVSTSETYSFEFSPDSPRTYYALFNSTETEQTDTDGELEYTIYEDAKLASVTSTTSTSVPSGDFTIPSVVSSGENSYKVYSIGSQAFSGCSSLTSITIPEGVTSIGANAFDSCRSLTSITLPSTLTSIGDSAFEGCSSLTSIKIPEGVTSIGNSAFYNCSGLTEITIPEGVTSIGSSAFSGCSSLTSVSLPSTLTSIDNSTFSYCGSLTSITLPSTLTSIGNDAFSNCSSLTSIILPSILTSIGRLAFNDCSGLTTITLPSTLTSIGYSAFYNCSSLTQITINGNISSLDSSAFYSCTNLTKLTLGAKVTSIPSNLFTDNNLLKLTEIIVEEDSSLTAALPGYGKWVKDEGSEDVPNFKGAGTYTRTDIQQP